MKTLQHVELLMVSAGVLCINGICRIVSSEGIPTNSFNVIEQNFQSYMMGSITENQFYMNIINANSLDYLHRYLENAAYNSSPVY